MTDQGEQQQFTTVAQVGAIQEGRGQSFAVNGRMIAVFCVDGAYHAIDDLCPHMGASLGAGDMTDGVVSCPWHAWRFRIRDGAWCDNPQIKVDRFDVRVEGDKIQVCVPANGRPSEGGCNGACDSERTSEE